MVKSSTSHVRSAGVHRAALCLRSPHQKASHEQQINDVTVARMVRSRVSKATISGFSVSTCLSPIDRVTQTFALRLRLCVRRESDYGEEHHIIVSEGDHLALK